MTTFRMGLLAIAALPLLAYSADAEELQCAWFPATCKGKEIVAPVDKACFGATPCDELGREYTDTTWPKTKADLARACERYTAQHGDGIDELCGE